MLPLNELPLALLSILWRLASFTTIRAYNTHDASWRACTFSSTLSAHGGTWTTWVLTALYVASTANPRPTWTWTTVAAPVIAGVLVVVVFLTHTSRGQGKPSDLFLGAPLVRRLPSASNLIAVVGIAADLFLLALRSGWVP
jgi:hypothetical protein